MARTTEELLRDLAALEVENGRLRALERELADAIESLRGSEARLRLAVDAARIGLWEWDMVSNRVSWDAKKYDVFGLAYGSFAGTKEAFFELVHPEDRPMLATAITRAVEEGAPYHNEFRIVAPSGETRWIANLGQVYRDDDGRPLRMLGVVYDVTERHATERALRESEEKFRALVEITSEWIWALDREGRITYSNPAVETILGYRPEELMEHPLRSLVHEADREPVERTLAEAIANRDGWSAFVVRCRHKDDTFRYLECQGVPIFDKAGQLIGFRGSDRDVTDRVEAEQELRDAHKMEGIGRLAGGFAHHFNNLLTIIAGHVEMAREESASQAIDADLHAVHQAAQRAALLTRQILAFAGKQFIKPRVLNLNEHLDGLKITLRRVAGERVSIVTHPSEELWAVKADPSQMEAVFLNFVVNAQEAMPDGGTLTITTANVAADDESAPHEAEVLPGEYVMVAFSDTGKGMTEEIAQQIFEPFFSTKQWGADTVGLGLSICYGIVAQHGGHIRVQTGPQMGSTFRIYLPRLLSAADVTHEGAATPIAQLAGSRTVLVVDDEAGVRTLAARILRTRGYSVLEAATGAEALVVARAWHGAIDLLVTDVVMQGMSGWELARQLEHERRNLETLFLSGHTENAAVPVEIVGKDLHLLHKPFAAGALARKVREILGSAKPRSVAEDVARDGRHVAIVDDHEAVRTAMVRVVEAAGSTAVAFPSAEAFLASDTVVSIDCLILDVQMPGMSGLQLQRHLVDRGFHVPIVFITADDHPAIRAQALAAGAIRVLHKAMLGEGLMEAVEAALRVKRRAEKQ